MLTRACALGARRRWAADARPAASPARLFVTPHFRHRRRQELIIYLATRGSASRFPLHTPNDRISRAQRRYVNSYAWRISSRTHGVSRCIRMAYCTSYAWRISPHMHGIPHHIRMAYPTAYAWRIAPHTHGVSHLICMAYPTSESYAWRIPPHTHGVPHLIRMAYLTFESH